MGIMKNNLIEHNFDCGHFSQIEEAFDVHKLPICKQLTHTKTLKLHPWWIH